MLQMCKNCIFFKEYDELDLVDSFQRRMSDGFCYDYDSDGYLKMPCLKVDWCKNFDDGKSKPFKFGKRAIKYMDLRKFCLGVVKGFI